MPQVHINDVLPSELFVIGAPEIDLIPDEIDTIVAFLKSAPDSHLRDIAFTTISRSASFHSRIAIVATSVSDLLEKLELARRRLASGNHRNAFTKGVYIGTDMCPAPGRTVFLFPGEGSQYPDMLRDLTLHFPACRAAFDAADTTIASCAADLNIPQKDTILPSRWIFPAVESPLAASEIPLSTPIAIQSVLAANTALLFLFRQLNITPDAVLGVDVGEITALECAGAIRLAEKKNRITLLGEGFRVISEISSDRKLIPPAITLSAAGLSRDALSSILAPFAPNAIIVADQTTDLFTITVTPDILPNVEAGLSAAGASFRRITTITKPFHTPLIKPFYNRLLSFYQSAINATPSIPVYSCHTCAPINGPLPQIAECAAQQWLSPLNVSKTIERLYDDGFRVFVELGARGILSTCVASTLRHKPHLALAANRGHRPDMLQFHHTLAALVSHGASVDLSQLHTGRNSLLLDFEHPNIANPDKHAKRLSLSRSFPSLADTPIPQGLIANLPAPSSASSLSPTSDDSGRIDFPCLNFAEIVRFSPENHIDLSLRFTPADFPYLLDRTLSAGSVSAFSKVSRGLSFAPLELLLELMAEAARKLFPNTIASSVENLQTNTFCPVSGDFFTVRIQAKCLPKSSSSSQPVEVSVFDMDSFTSETPTRIASSVIRLSPSFPSSPDASPLSLKSPIRVNWNDSDLYPIRLPTGESARGIKSIPELGENGLRAECFIPPRSTITRASTEPRFSVAPIILATLSDALSALHSREPASGILHLFYACERIDFFSPQLPVWTPFTANIFANPLRPNDHFATASAEVLDSDHHLLLKISGLSNRVIRITPEFHRQILNPFGGYLSSEVPKSSLPSLPHEVICCRITRTGPADDDEPLRMRIAAALTLSPSELDKWLDICTNTSISRQREWLFGRIAAKDAVRKCLLARYGRKLGAADVRIESDEAGKPSPQGQWRKLCGAHMDISITHTDVCIAAAAAPNASLGIDIERRDRTISEEFASSAFSQHEQAIAAESGDGATALFRFWCAKEALSKALGSGLRYGPSDLCARTLDQNTGKVEMEATKLWLSPFPQLRDRKIDVQTCLLDDIILAVCVLNPSLAKSETGPFIRLY